MSLIPSCIMFPEPTINDDQELDNSLDNSLDITNNENKIQFQDNFNINYAQLESLSLNNLLNLPNLPKPKVGVSLCLNMIVRNESKIITRLLNSVLPIIDTYLICDTGSTDDTISIIKDFFDS